MALRVAATLSLFCFAACLVAGLVSAGNGFGTVVWRALVAMAGTFCVGLVVGKMTQIMIAEDKARQTRMLDEAREQRMAAIRQREPILEVGSGNPPERVR